MLQKILESGTLVGEGMEDKISQLKPEQVELFLGLRQKPLVFDYRVWKAITNPEVKVIKNRYRSDKQSVQDLVNKYNQRFNVLRDELLQKGELINLTSVSSVKNSDGIVSIVGMFDGKYLEDQTGRIEISIPASQKILKNEVVGVIGKVSGDKFLVDRIVWPDVKAKEVKKTELPAVVCITRDSRDVKGVNYVVTSDTASMPEGVAVVNMDGFGEFEIGGIRFLIVKEGIGNGAKEINKEEREVGKEILKRRNLFYKNKWIKDVPDVFVSLTKQSFVENYKGVTIVGMGDSPILLDLGSREQI